jgi:hypothetical protein
MIIARIFVWRSSAMNMCSVRHRPIPSAPNSRALAASSGVSALARTPSVRSSSAQASTVSNCSLTFGSSSGTSSAVTIPAEPSIAIVSPSPSSVPFTRSLLPCRSMSSADAPDTHGFPIPRATSAAWLALPPSAVRIPFAAWKPATSSASVKGRTRITSRPSAAASTASWAVNTISPRAAPGEAATPSASVSNSAPWAKPGWSRASSLAASMVAIASSFSSSPSSTASTAKRTPACAGRFALRVWSM